MLKYKAQEELKLRSPKETFEKYLSVGTGKTQQTVLKTFLLAIMAGMYIAFAGVASTFANALVNKVCGALMFCGGLSMVLVAGSELFTGNCLLIIPLSDKKIKASAMLRNLVTVYIGNFVGALIVALCAVYSGALDSVAETAVNTALAKSSLTFLSAFLKGFLCNVLVCVAVWMSFTSDKTADKIIAVIFPVAFFVLCGFEHSIANMYFIPAGMLLDGIHNITENGISLFGFFINNLLPVTFGNILGGFAVGGVYYAVFSKKQKKK